MEVRTLLAAIGTGITSFLVVAVLVIELLDFEFSALIGLPVGLLVGTATVAVILFRYGTLSRGVRVVLDACAGFGFGIVLLLGASYVSLADFTVEVTVGIAAALGVLAGFSSWLVRR